MLSLLKWFSVLPYAIGNQSEEIKYSLLLSLVRKSKYFDRMIVLPALPGYIERLLNFKSANRLLIEIVFELNVSRFGLFTTYFSHLIFNVYFIVFRSIYLLLKSSISSNSLLLYQYYFLFPRHGVLDLWNSSNYFNRLSFKKFFLISLSDLYKKRCFPLINEATCKCLNKYDSDLNSLLSGLDFNTNSRVVIIHTRSSTYYNDGERRNRNMSLENYIDGIQCLIDHNITPVLIGDQHNLDIPKNVIDLTVHHLSSQHRDLLTFYFMRRCQLYIGTQSGQLIWLFYLIFLPAIKLYRHYTPNIFSATDDFYYEAHS